MLKMKKYVKLQKCKLQQDKESSRRPKLMEEEEEEEEEEINYKQTLQRERIRAVDHRDEVGVAPHTPRSSKLMDSMRRLILQRQSSNFGPNKNNTIIASDP
ncbi:hypothetical protein Pyn_32468 [Prunus yedoensis var. nudiflora]|uniref:Uncharacterized protein n=1 Tax=Prunus yedoensis var. nudiflora TaxID=2094558 RepID=A0A314ZRX1_PRUYE|nr:hypothetical protein Pyn_32468 [Prunus yedoensis var. nudiflora]